MDVSFNINRSEESDDYNKRATMPNPIFNTAYIATQNQPVTYDLDPDEEGTAALVKGQNAIYEQKQQYV